MGMKNKGWIKLHRKITDWEFYFSEPFTKTQAWIDMIILANHKPSTLIKRGIPVKVKRGELAWSEEQLGERWRWSRGKVRRFLSLLETRQQIVQQKCFTVSTISIVRYEDYQEDGTASSTADGQQTDSRRTADSTNNNKGENAKNDKNEKNIELATPDGVAVKKSIDLIMEKFQMGLNPTISYGNKTQRKAVKSLLDLMGAEKLGRTIDYAVSIKHETFAPVITTPYQLKEKLSQLIAYQQKQKSKERVIRFIS